MTYTLILELLYVIVYLFGLLTGFIACKKMRQDND